MNLSALLSGQPPVKRIENARSLIRQRLLASGKRLVVIDDDPTGPQAVHDVPVYMDWSIETLQKAFATGDPVFFICTNSRSMSPDEMRAVSLEAGQNLNEAAEREHAGFLLTSRGDSTLRGHFFAEINALIEGVQKIPDGIILVPAFFEGKRYTVGDIHYADQKGEMTPVHQTEFARDPSFSYTNSDLKKWTEEKTGGAIKTDDIISISLNTIRKNGPEAVANELKKASDGQVVIVNAACYEDLEIVSLGLSLAEQQGKTYVYRCSASFIKARGGFEDKPLLIHEDLAPEQATGLIIAGSYVEKTSRQLQCLLDSGFAEGIELHTDRLTDEDTAGDEIMRISDYVNSKMKRGITAVIYTSREMERKTGEAFRETGSRIMQALCRIVRNIEMKPGFVIAKGGITSIEIARSALEAREAFAIGQILPGVPVWRLGKESRWPGIPYVVFPGNVGEEDAVLKAVHLLHT